MWRLSRCIFTHCIRIRYKTGRFDNLAEPVSPELWRDRAMRCIVFSLLMAFLSLAQVSWAEIQDYQRASQYEIYRAMVNERQKGYELTKTTNAGRLWVSVVLQLVESAHSIDPDGPPIYIDQSEYFPAFLRAADIQEETAPEWARLPYQFQQNSMIEYRMPMVIDTTRSAQRPLRALSVRTWWPDSSSYPKTYSFRDTLSTPKLIVVNEREIRYKLLDYGDMVVIDKMRGLRGRPTSGLLDLLFRIIGTGRVVFARSAISSDGLLIVYGKAIKIFSKSTTITVYPDGIVKKGLPRDRPDLETIEYRLKHPPEVTYR